MMAPLIAFVSWRKLKEFLLMLGSLAVICLRLSPELGSPEVHPFSTLGSQYIY